MLDSSVLVGIIRGEPDTGRLLGLLRATNVFSCQAELVEQTAGAGPAEGVPGSDCKRVEEADAGLLEAGVVARDNDQVVGLRAPRREDLRAILPTASPFQLPMPSNEAAERPRRRPLETGAPFALAQQQNAESQLAEDYGIDGLFTLVAPEPFDHLGNGRRLGRLAQHVGVDQIPHSSSVDADSTGTKKPFAGHASNQSTTPSFGGAKRRVRRYSPRSSRSTSNSWPASMRSCRRISTGNTIWPFEETVVFMSCKMTSYKTRSRKPQPTG